MALFAIVDKTSLERRLDTRDDGFINIAFALFASCDFDVDVDEFLPIDDGHAQFFCVRGID